MLSKKFIFRVILVLIPFVFFLLLELALRVSGYSDDQELVSKVERNSKEYYTINQLVGKRYFNKERMYYRKGSHDYFEINKSPQTIRVFCLGASTMAGFPYEYNAIPSEFLRDRLAAAFPDKNIEVINTAIAATNSFTVDEFADELVEYKPDLFIIYMGQNEFYGVYGVGSTISLGKSRSLIKTYLWLEHFKTFLLLKSMINSISSLFGTEDTLGNKVLMEEMAKTSIKYGSDDFKTAVNTFRENYIEVIKTAQKNNIPIIISNLVRNEDGMHPFVSFHSDSLSDSMESRSKELFRLGQERMDSTDYPAAAEFFNKSLSLDSVPADVHYSLGKCYQFMGKYEQAEEQYSLAADLDGLRFRAPSVFNNIIHQLGKKFGIPVSDVIGQFRENSENGIIGSKLLVDHVHPNIHGYFLLAKAWFHTISQNKMLGTPSGTQESDSLIWNKAAITDLDSLIGALKIMELKSRPPFTKSDSIFNFTPVNAPEQIAYQYAVLHKLSWAETHLSAGKYYLTIGNFARALDELRAILVSDEDNPRILKLAGDMSLQMNLFQQAEGYYTKANKIDANQFIEYKLGKTELLLGKTRLAIEFFNSALERNSQSKDRLGTAEMEDLYYNLAAAYNKNNEPDKAREVMQKLFK
jgi:tetratricopeptide (TPR) repeat protein